MKLTKSFVVGAPPERVGAVLCSEPFNIEAERERPEVVGSRVQLVEDSAERVVFEVRSTEYKRKKTGGIDRSGTVESVTRHTYDRRAHTLSWVYQGVGSNWVKVAGVYHLGATPSGTQVVHEITIEVKIPLLGGAISRLIASEFDAAAERFQRLLTLQATRSP